jgi:hypothetical protein
MDKDRPANTWPAFQPAAYRMQDWFVRIAVKPAGMPSLYVLYDDVHCYFRSRGAGWN